MAAACGYAVVLIGLLPGLVLLSPGVRFGAALALQCVVVAHTGGALTRVLTSASVRLVALGFWLFAYVWLGLAPLAMLATDTYPLGYRTGQATAFATVALTELGLLAYSAGAALAANRVRRRSVLLEPLLSRSLVPVPVLLLSGLAVVLAVLLIPRQGGWDAFFTSRQAVRESGAAIDPETGSATGTGRTLLIWAVAVAAFWAMVALVHLPRRPARDQVLRRFRWILLPLVVAINLVVNNPISKPRFWSGTVLLTLLFASSRFSRPQACRLAAAAVTAVVLLVFPYGNYFRYDQREPVHVVALAEQFTGGMDYDAFQQMQTGIDYARDTGFSPSSALGPVLFMVPRTMWPDKPVDTGARLAEYAGYDFKNLSAPLWIEAYLWAGIPSVIAVFCLLGAVGARMDHIRERLAGKRATLAALLVPGFAFYQIVVLRGGLMAVAGPLLLLLTIPLLITGRAARSARSLSPAPPYETAGHVPIPGTGGNRDQPHQLR
ncbi:hypothetical protein ABZ484_05565 [Streptomyces sp. NPDC006393]|uniref:hypothetical protein n=1 Tax=Streptomyces sp. NPDC006393 TaxID=3156763 RepID=UPI0034106674